MEIIATPTYATAPFLYFTHDNASISMHAGAVLRPSLSEQMPRLFYYVNWFFSQLPKNRQDKIFSIYRQAEELLRVVPDSEAGSDMPMINAEVRELFAELLKQMPANELYEWIKPSEMYPWPVAAELPRAYREAASAKYPEEKTYILSEYQQLFALIMQLRACAPIWAAYLQKYQGAFAVSYRDIILVGLLDESEFFTTPAYMRLKAYVNAWIGGKEEIMSSGVMHGISTDDYPQWLLCDVLMRKLVFQSFDSPQANDASPFVIKHMSNHLRDRTAKSPDTFNTPQRKIVPDGNGREGSDEIRSMFEVSRVHQRIGNGERWLMQIYCENPEAVLKTLEPQMDKGISDSIFSSFNYGEYVPSNEQLLVALWVVSPSVSVRAENDLTRLNAAMVCAVATCVLWHRGHKLLAAWISSHQGQPIARAGMINPSSIRYPREIYPEIESIFKWSEKLKNATPVRTVVADVIVEAEKHLWTPKLPTSMIVEAKNILIDGAKNTMIVGSDDSPVLQVNQQLAYALMIAVIDLAKRPNPMCGWDKATAIAKEMGLPSAPTPWKPVLPPERKIM